MITDHALSAPPTQRGNTPNSTARANSTSKSSKSQKDAIRARSSPHNTAIEGDDEADGEPKRRRRIVNRDPNRPSPKAWSVEEVEKFKTLIDREGPGGWENKAVLLGSGRSAKALHTRWLREQGRIVDRPRQVLTSGTANIVEQSALEALLMMSTDDQES